MLGDSPEDCKAYEAIGRFTVTFATLETVVDAIGAIVFNGYEGKSIISRLPRHISSKKEFLPSTKPAFEEFAGELTFLLNSLEKLLEIRHFIVHGIYGENPDCQMVFAKPVVTMDNMHVVHLAATAETIDSHRQLATHLVGRSAGLALKLSDHIKS